MDRQIDAFAAVSEQAHTRKASPETSKAAAASVQNMRASHKRVLAMFRTYGDMTDETLAEYLNEAAKDTGIKLMSPSGVRSRRSELSKPNMDRIEQILDEVKTEHAGIGDEAASVLARARLSIEGLRAPLWDTGKREKLSSGRMAIVWGVAR
jgi:hypothetical protein